MNTKPLILNKDLVENTSAFLKYLVKNGGPELQEYEKFTSIVNSLDASDVDDFRKEISAILNENTLIGHGFVKPYGYPGDFTLIDKIYRFDVNQDLPNTKTGIFFFRVNLVPLPSETVRIFLLNIAKPY